MANPPAGWHPDPLSRHAQRYWDGNQWTEHVADQSGNMSTDPLDGGQSAQQEAQQATGQATADTGGWGQSSSDATTTSSWGEADQAATTATGDAGTDTPSWGGTTDPDQAATPDQSTPADTPAWGDTSTDAGATSDDAPAWGDTATADTPAWGEPDPTPHTVDESAHADATDEPAWGSGGAAAGAAAAAGGAAAGSTSAGTTGDGTIARDDDHADPATSDHGGWRDEVGAGTASDAGSGGGGGVSNATVDHPTIAEIEVGDGVVVRHGRIVATAGDVALGDSPHPGSLNATGSGTVHVGAGGRQITVLDVPAAGLTIHDDALVAHSVGLHREAASDGIVGYDATAVSGGGWVAIAAVGGAKELSPVGGVDVVVGALVAWSSDLDVTHAEHVNLAGRGIVLVSAGD